ncbi:MAG: LamG domain-containing protein, partial [Ruminococcaceae bacterium]|nr:LamG domain-containing protein [Oscillospiraceae bacterium]
MKKLSLILAALLVGTSLIFVPAAATDAMGADLLASADVYLDFENESYANLNDQAYTVVSEGDTYFVDGRFGGAANIFSGANYLTVENLTFGADSYTITAWFQVLSYSGDPAMFGNKDWSGGKNPGIVMAYKGNSAIFNSALGARDEGSARLDVEATIPGASDEWKHLAVVVDRATNTYTVYINGQPKDGSIPEQGTGVHDDEVNGYPFNIGEDGTGIYNLGNELVINYDEFAV